MTSLENIIIDQIEKASGVELPQQERTLIQDIVSKHEFDEESARMFGEFYVNVNYKYNLPEKIACTFNHALKNIENIVNRPHFCELYPQLHNSLIKKAINFLDIMANTFSANKNICDDKLIQTKINPYIHEILSLIYVVNFIPHEFKEGTHISHINRGKEYLDTLEKLFKIESNILFPGYLKNGKLTNSFLIDFFLKIMAKLKYAAAELYQEYNYDIILRHWLNELSKYKTLDGKTIKIESQLNDLSNTNLYDSTFMSASKFLSQHNPETESFYEIFNKMINIMRIKIPDYKIIDFLSNIKVPEFDEKYEQLNIDADQFYRSFHYLITFITNILDPDPSSRILKKNNLSW